METTYAKEYGDKKLICILNGITAATRCEFYAALANKTAEMRLPEQRKRRLMALSCIRLKELGL